MILNTDFAPKQIGPKGAGIGSPGPGERLGFPRACRRNGPRAGRPRWGTTSATLRVSRRKRHSYHDRTSFDALLSLTSVVFVPRGVCNSQYPFPGESNWSKLIKNIKEQAKTDKTPINIDKQVTEIGGLLKPPRDSQSVVYHCKDPGKRANDGGGKQTQK